MTKYIIINHETGNIHKITKYSTLAAILYITNKIKGEDVKIIPEQW